MKITDIEAKVVSTPLIPPVKPYGSAAGETTKAESVIIRISTDDGIEGWGETHTDFAPSAVENETCEDMKRVLAGQNPFDIEKILQLLRSRFGFMNTIARSDITDMINGLDIALWDIAGKAVGKPVYELFGGLLKEKIPVAACQGIREPEEAGSTAKLYANQGFLTIKTKGGRSMQQDIAIIKAMREAVGNSVELRIDPNQGYDTPTALRLLRALDRYDLQYVEQPIRRDALDDLARLRLSTNTPIAVNESVQSLRDLLQVIEKRAADLVLVDFYLGGFTGLRKAGAIADTCAIPLVMHCNHDFGIKTAATLHAVGSIPGFKYAMDSTYHGQADDVLKYKLKIERGHIKVPDGPGLGITVDETKLEKLSASSQSK